MEIVQCIRQRMESKEAGKPRPREESGRRGWKGVSVVRVVAVAGDEQGREQYPTVASINGNEPKLPLRKQRATCAF